MIEISIVRDPAHGIDAAESDAIGHPDPETPLATEGEAGDCIMEDSVAEEIDLLSEESSEPADSVCPNGSLAAEVTSIGDKMGDLLRAIVGNDRTVAELVLRDELAARLHDRLTRYEENAWERRYLDPLTRGIASLHRRILEQLTLVRRRLRAIPSELRKHSMEFWTHGALDGVRAELETVLSDLGIELVVVDGTRFDRSCQEAVQRIPTSDTSRVGRIAHRLAPGFRAGERVIIPERVAVFAQAADACS